MSSISKRRKQYSGSVCPECNMSLTEVCVNEFDCENANSELETLTNPDLLSVYESANDSEIDAFPTHKLTQFSVYDRHGHLVAVDSGLIENGAEIFVSGFVKRIDDEDSIGIATKDIGPINEWWIGGFDGGISLLIGLESCSATYILVEPSSAYSPFFAKIIDKLYLCKYTIEFLTKNIDSSYEELIDYIQGRSDGKYNEDLLLSNSSFVIEQIMSYDEAANETDPLLLETRCIQDMLEFCADRVPIQSVKHTFKMRHIVRKDARRLSNSDTYATSTTLVREFFEEMFKEAIDQTCVNKSTRETKKGKHVNRRRQTNKINCKINWHKPPTHKDTFSRIKYYNSVKISDSEYNSKDFVVTNDGFGIGRIAFLMETQSGEKLAHIHWFCHGFDTLLKEAGDQHQIFMRYDCENVSIDRIIRKVSVYLCHSVVVSVEDTEYICKKVYFPESGHFENLPDMKIDQGKTFCMSCEFKEQQQKTSIIFGEEIEGSDGKIQLKSVCLKNEWYSPKDCVMLTPESFVCNSVSPSEPDPEASEAFDESIYTEKYRKSFSEFIKGSLSDVPPYTKIGQIVSIVKTGCTDSQEVDLEIVKFYRPEYVFKTFDEACERDVNEVFLTNETVIVKKENIISKCKVYYCENLPAVKSAFPNWLYFRFLYDCNEQTLRIPLQSEITKFEVFKECHNSSTRKLRTLDLFAGCGGLALGFLNSGVSKTLWAVEKDGYAAASFRKNFPNTTVFEEDANLLLKQIISGCRHSENGQHLPKKGDVEMILAGPPCQGFSGINRFSSRQYSLFKNSLIITLLSYIDYFRPSYVVIENVRNFVLFKNSMILKLTLSCLIRMDYQVRFGVMQAGAFGVPQSRRRAFIFAASPTMKLPNFPQPMHTFSQRSCQLSVFVDGIRYSPSVDYKYAPFRAITVRDAISDLRKTCAISQDAEVEYESNPKCQFQRMLRLKTKETISDHCCKQISALTQARINEIPHFPGSDWRDLPNIRLQLPNGTIVNKLVYKYHDVKNGKSKDGKLRGVCECASGADCNVSISRQENTLIPWCLVHTANRQYQWTGLYGRLQFNGFFPTIVTNPEPIGKQGRVIHPEENRIISVRECARSQTFPDSFVFVGGVPDRHRQIGNAVPPMLAHCIGVEFKVAMTAAKTPGLAVDQLR